LVTDATVLIHDRMPVILDPHSYDLWLDPAMTRLSAVSDLLKLYDARLMRYYRASTRINSVAPAVGIRKVAQCLASSILSAREVVIVAYQRKRYTRGLGTDLAKTGVERSPKSSPLRRALRAIGLTRAGKPRNCRICRLSFRIAVKECRQVLTVGLTTC
jgi:SOS response associated peptidase (SRAP)